MALNLAGPILILTAVLVLLRDFAFRGMVSSQHPDLLSQWLPWYCYLGKSLAAAHIPSWNPSAMGGLPFAADPQSGWMYLPAMILFTALPCHLAIGWMIVLQPLLGGIGLYSFLRSEGLSRPGATTGGLLLALVLADSRLGVFLPFPSALAWTAVVLACCSRYVHAENWTQRLVWCALTAAAWGQLAAAHFAHGLVLGSGTLFLYLATRVGVRLFRREWSPGRSAAVVALLVASLPAVSLAYLLPRLNYLSESSYQLGKGALGRLSGLLSPTWPLKFALFPGAYFGALGLVLSAAGLATRRHRALAAAFALLGTVSFVVSLRRVGHVIASVLRPFPFVDLYVHFPARFSFGVLIAIPVLAAIGVETWLHVRSLRQRVLLLVPGVLIWGVAPVAFGAPAGGLVFLFVGAIAGAMALWVAARHSALVALVPVVIAVELVVNGLLGQAPSRFTLKAALKDDRFAKAPAGWYAPLLRPDVSAAQYERADPIVQELVKQKGGRVLSLVPSLATHRGYLTREEPAYWPLLVNQRAMLFGIEEVQGYNPIQLPRFWRFTRAVADRRLDYNAAVFPSPTDTVLNLLQVRWVVGSATEPPLPNLSPVVTEGEWRLYRLLDDTPRASLVTSWTVVGSPDAALHATIARGFDPLRSVILEEPPGIQAFGTATSSAAFVRYFQLGPQAARILVESATGGIVLIRTPYESHWHALMDGQRAHVLAADFIDQAVAVPPGRHTIQLSYDDPSVGYGLLGSAIALGCLLGAAIFVRRTSAPQARVSEPPSNGADVA